MSGNASVRAEKDVVFATAGGIDLKLDVSRPPAGVAEKGVAIIELFGGGFVRGSKAGHYEGVFQRFAERGYVAIAATYRLAAEAKWPAQVEDAKAAVRWVRENAGRLGVDPEKAVLSGYSAGGQLAIVAAGTAAPEKRVAAVIAYYPSRFGRSADGKDFPVMPEGASDAEYEAAEPLTYMRPGFPPTIFFCGTSDVFAEPTKRLFEALQEAGVPAELHLLAGLPHIYDRFPEFAAVSTELCDLFIDRYVVNPREYPAFRAPQPAAAPS